MTFSFFVHVHLQNCLRLDSLLHSTGLQQAMGPNLGVVQKMVTHTTPFSFREICSDQLRMKRAQLIQLVRLHPK